MVTSRVPPLLCGIRTICRLIRLAAVNPSPPLTLYHWAPFWPLVIKWPIDWVAPLSFVVLEGLLTSRLFVWTTLWSAWVESFCQFKVSLWSSLQAAMNLLTYIWQPERNELKVFPLVISCRITINCWARTSTKLILNKQSSRWLNLVIQGWVNQSFFAVLETNPMPNKAEKKRVFFTCLQLLSRKKSESSAARIQIFASW